MSTIDRMMDDVENPRVALDLIKEVVGTYESDPSMMDYRFFEERAAFALVAADALDNQGARLSEEDQRFVDYLNKEIRPKL